jgi:hypothetical protein
VYSTRWEQADPIFTRVKMLTSAHTAHCARASAHIHYDLFLSSFIYLFPLSILYLSIYLSIYLSLKLNQIHLHTTARAHTLTDTHTHTHARALTHTQAKKAMEAANADAGGAVDDDGR